MPVSLLPEDYRPRADLLRDCNILVTGATGAIGAAASRALAGHGATVVLLGRSTARLEKLYDDIEAAGGPAPLIAPLNLLTATWGDYEQLAAQLSAELGKLDGILHAAAQFRSFTRLEDLEPHEWLDSLQVNLTAPYVLTRLCLPLLRRAPQSSVVFLADKGGREPRAFHNIYGVTKAAVEMLFKTWASELEAEGRVRFNSYYPGPIRSALRARGFAGDPANLTSKPAETAVPALLWLLGPDSRGVSGQSF